MKPVVVADTGPLIALAKLQQLDLLCRVFFEVYVPQTVLLEATRNPARKDARLIQQFSGQFCKITPDIDDALRAKLRKSLGEGEVQALVLAKKLGCTTLMVL
jgi:predicted nucleic acid-binding protein